MDALPTAGVPATSSQSLGQTSSIGYSSQEVIQQALWPPGVVEGMPTSKSRVVKALNQVLLTVAAGATFYVMWFVVELLRGCYSVDGSDLWDGDAHEPGPGHQARAASRETEGISHLLLDLVTPCCGYFGAVHSNRQLTCCFCSFNLVSSVWALVFLIAPLLHGRFQFSRENLRTLMLGGISLLAFWFGNRLYALLSSDRPLSFSAPPLVGEVVTIDHSRSGSPSIAASPGVAVAATASPRGSGVPAPLRPQSPRWPPRIALGGVQQEDVPDQSSLRV